MAQGTADLDEARAGYDDHRWSDAAEAFARAGGFASLEPADAERYAWSIVWTGAPAAGCLDAFERLEQVCRADGQTHGAARAALEQARMHALVGNEAVSAACWARGLDHLDGDEDCAEYGMAMALAAYARLLQGEGEDATQLASVGLDIGQRVGDPTVEALSSFISGQALTLADDVEEGLARLDHALSLGLGGDVQPMYAGTVHCGVLWTCRQIGDWARAVEWQEVAERWCDRESLVHFPAHLSLYRSDLARVQGRLDEALQAGLEALEDAGDWNRELVAWSHHQIGECRLALGDLSGAETSFARADELGHDPEPGRSLLLMAREEADAALRTITHTIESPHYSAMTSLLHTLPAGVSIAAGLGHLDTADSWCDRLSALADRYGTDAAGAAARTARGELLLARAETTEAVEQLYAAVRLWQRSGAVLDAARTRVTLARAHAADGDDTAARSELETARSAFVRFGARWEAKRVAAMQLGAGEDAEALTPRQRDVAALVAKGFTNAQIADELVVSRYTAETHVKHILTRLGFSTRAEIAAWANERGLAGQRSNTQVR